MQLIYQTLNEANDIEANLILRSARGYLFYGYKNKLNDLDIIPSMSRRENSLNNMSV